MTTTTQPFVIGPQLCRSSIAFMIRSLEFRKCFLNCKSICHDNNSHPPIVPPNGLRMRERFVQLVLLTRAVDRVQKRDRGNPIWHRATSTFVRNKISQILSSQIYSRNSDHLVLLKKFQFVLTSFVFCTNQYNFGLSSVKVKVENIRIATPDFQLPIMLYKIEMMNASNSPNAQ